MSSGPGGESPLRRPGSHESSLAGDAALVGTSVWEAVGCCEKGPKTEGNNTSTEGTGRDGRETRRVTVSRQLRQESHFSGEERLISQKSPGKYWI